MKFYDFVDKGPAIGTLVIIEGTERVFADRALDLVIERLLPAEMRDMNLERFAATQLDGTARIREAAQAMPFLGSSRVVVVTETQTLKAAMRRDLWDVASAVPQGNTLVLSDLLSPRSKRPEPFGAMAGRAALRIDTTANAGARVRFIEETLGELNAKAEPRVIDALAHSEADLVCVRNDLEKLALQKKTIAYKDLQQEALTVEDPKAYLYASALVEGRTADALLIAQELLANDRGAAIALVAALAKECQYVWEMARPGGSIPERLRWRERGLRPVTARLGETRARRAFERAVETFDAIVTGRADDGQTAVEMLTGEVSLLSAQHPPHDRSVPSGGAG